MKGWVIFMDKFRPGICCVFCFFHKTLQKFIKFSSKEKLKVGIVIYIQFSIQFVDHYWKFIMWLIRKRWVFPDSECIFAWFVRQRLSSYCQRFLRWRNKWGGYGNLFSGSGFNYPYKQNTASSSVNLREIWLCIQSYFDHIP